MQHGFSLLVPSLVFATCRGVERLARENSLHCNGGVHNKSCSFVLQTCKTKIHARPRSELDSALLKQVVSPVAE